MEKVKELSIVIVSYNVKSYLRDCLGSLKDTLPVNSEVIVVDNNSSDGTREEIPVMFPEVNFIANNFNAGFSEANNIGMKHARGEYILLLNPDTEVKPDAVQKLLLAIRDEERTVVIGPKLLNTDGSLQRSAWKFPGIGSIASEAFFLSYFFDSTSYSDHKYSARFNSDFVSGAAMIFHKSIFNQMGGLDRDLFWMEDTDLCYRVWKSGGKVICDPGAVITHHSGKSAGGNLRIAIRNQLISKLKFFRKHRMYLTYFFAAVLIFFQLLNRTVLFLALAPFSGNNRKKLDAYIRSIPAFIIYLFTGKSKLA